MEAYEAPYCSPGQFPKANLCTQVCRKAFGRADLLKRHRANHDDNGNGNKKRRINSSPGAGRVAHACQACAKARVKCEEQKPCTRCRTRNLNCEYASSEAGSAAAMHLLHLSANAHSGASPAVSPTASMGPASGNLASDLLSSQLSQPAPMQGLPTHAAPAMTNPPYSHSTGSSPSTLTNHQQGVHDAAQLPTPETMIDQSEWFFLSIHGQELLLHPKPTPSFLGSISLAVSPPASFPWFFGYLMLSCYCCIAWHLYLFMGFMPYSGITFHLHNYLSQSAGAARPNVYWLRYQ